MKTKLKKLLYVLLPVAIVMSLSSCLFELFLIDYASHLVSFTEPSYFYVHFINNSDNRISVGGLTIASPSKKNKELQDTTFWLLGDVEAHSFNDKLYFWTYSPDADENASWDLFFRDYELDSLEIAVANSMEELSLWEKQKNDSILLKKYVFTLPDLNSERNTVTITYP